MFEQVVAELAPDGVLRAGINVSNFLLVTGTGPNGEPEGVAPDMARAVADRLGVRLVLVPFAQPGLLADAAEAGVWTIGLIGAEPDRAKTIAFSAAYAEIEATYLVPPGSSLRTIDDVDSAGTRIAVPGRAAYGLWLDRSIKRATLVKTDSIASAYEAFVQSGLEALAGLLPRLLQDAQTLPGARILEGGFTAVQQAIGTPRQNLAGAAFLLDFIEQAKASGLVAQLIAKHQVQGLSVAPAA
jgi:polar amino acid transport system substrate-binding protein